MRVENWVRPTSHNLLVKSLSQILSWDRLVLSFSFTFVFLNILFFLKNFLFLNHCLCIFTIIFIVFFFLRRTAVLLLKLEVVWITTLEYNCLKAYSIQTLLSHMLFRMRNCMDQELSDSKMIYSYIYDICSIHSLAVYIRFLFHLFV